MAAYDFAVVFRAVREHYSISQEQLGTLLGLTQSRISAIERGSHKIRDVSVVARIAEALQIPGEMLGFESLHAVAQFAALDHSNHIDRRTFFETIMNIMLGVTMGEPYDPLDRVAYLTSGYSPTRIGHGDVDAIEQITAGINAWGFKHGGGVTRQVAIGQLHAVRSLERIDCEKQVHTRLVMAIAHLASTTAWIHYDVGDNRSARNLWIGSMQTAKRSGHHLRSDFVARQLIALNHQSIHLGQSDEAVQLMRIAAGMESSDAFLTPIMRSYVHTNFSWAHATSGDENRSLEELAKGYEIFEDVEQGPRNPWSASIHRAEMEGQRGQILFRLSRRNPDHARAALASLLVATDGYGLAQARSLAMNLPCIAEVHLQLGDMESALAVGHKAIKTILGISCERPYRRLADLRRALSAHESDSSISDFGRFLDGHLKAATPRRFNSC
ncbi:helix-turn-helix domain-containing protein [Alloactinosynnema sp. L-07]|uniref:helix-turn-helix domain-containing protein n=1 Tax=Alloactinosynnema sp. L-07 TaxID=1653480 RepID=UPI0015612900|nr:helix-turn-helix transcriptional regulator [Alloactinosynnema sp. L-07]